ncbi:hypothetical protein KEJ12_04800 [Candidatus Bathyarchaeota archaeon]|nr:hypothetical protein [Candidatus Bathyarchaeota archaeon]
MTWFDASTLGFIDLGAPFIDARFIGLHPFRVNLHLPLSRTTGLIQPLLTYSLKVV